MILDFFFPNRCLGCEIIISPEEIVCKNCLEKVSFYHHNFSAENEFLAKCRVLFPTENASALLYFEKEGLSRKIIHSLKYGGREKVGKALANCLAERHPEIFKNIDLIATVPLHPKKLRKRGYNQLHLFADEISKKTKIPVDHGLIVRKIYKKAQAKSDKAHRAETESVFKLAKKISGKKILLVDDVFTTGNTMASVAWEILQNSDNQINVFAMAVEI